MIQHCNSNCISEYQDKKYGKNRRVHTESKKNGNVRCTVCGGKPRWETRGIVGWTPACSLPPKSNGPFYGP